MQGLVRQGRKVCGLWYLWYLCVCRMGEPHGRGNATHVICVYRGACWWGVVYMVVSVGHGCRCAGIVWYGGARRIVYVMINGGPMPPLRAVQRPGYHAKESLSNGRRNGIHPDVAIRLCEWA